MTTTEDPTVSITVDASGLNVLIPLARGWMTRAEAFNQAQDRDWLIRQTDTDRNYLVFPDLYGLLEES